MQPAFDGQQWQKSPPRIGMRVRIHTTFYGPIMHQQCGVLIAVEQHALYPYVVKVEGVNGFLHGAVCYLNEHEVEVMGDSGDASPSDEAN